MVGISTPKTKKGPKPRVENSPSIRQYCVISKKECEGKKKAESDMVNKKTTDTEQVKENAPDNLNKKEGDKPLTNKKKPETSTNTSTMKHVNKGKGIMINKSKSFPTGEAENTENISSEERSGMNMGTRKSKPFLIGEA